MGKGKGRDISGLLGKMAPETAKAPTNVKRMNIRFDDDDQAHILRVMDELRKRGVVVTEKAQLIRVALRVAFNEPKTDELSQMCDELAEKWKRGV